MARIHINVALEPEVYHLARESIDNLSGFFNDVLKETLEEENPESKKVFQLRKYIDNLEKQAKAKEGTLKDLDIEINKKEKKRLEGMCFKCGSPSDRTFRDQLICKACFMKI
tara:strand:+ start:220 stop:555 length:336 start_codon:yes stop_codon:yes gene_type:complete